ncbi:MAG TPA: hypothetical protein VN886_06115 [Acidimicrobiales bacterium]|nr:hypothetical protein [Acidimicrobiales bacterium]
MTTLGLVPVPDRAFVEAHAPLDDLELWQLHDAFKAQTGAPEAPEPTRTYALFAAEVCKRTLAGDGVDDIVGGLNDAAYLWVHYELREPIDALMAEFTPAEEFEAVLDVFLRILARQPVPRDEHGAAMTYVANLIAASEAGGVGNAPVPLIEAVAGLLSKKGNQNAQTED